MEKVVFLLTHSEAEFWTKTYPAVDFNEQYSQYHFIVLDNGNQPLMKEWCNLTNSTYYPAEFNIGSSGGYNWIFRVAHLIKCNRAVLLQTDVEILEQDALIEKEIKDGVIPDPSQPIDPQTGMPLDQTSQMDLGQPVMEPDLNSQARDTMPSTKAVEMPKGGEI